MTSEAFTDKIRKMVDRVGSTAEAGRIIGVSSNTVGRWYHGRVPTVPTCVGALSIMRAHLRKNRGKITTPLNGNSLLRRPKDQL